MHRQQSTFPVYRGLQKPLVFKSFRGKYIYWGLGTILTGLLVSMLAFAVFNLLSGCITMIFILGPGLGYTAYRQKRGPKARFSGFLEIPNQPMDHEA